MKRKLLLIICLFMFFPLTLFATGSVNVDKSSVTIEKGKTATFTVSAKNSAGKITFSSSNSSVASIDKSSEWLDNNSVKVTIKANEAGSTKINIDINAATYDEEVIKKTQTITVTVTPPKSSNNNLSSLKVNDTLILGFSSSKTSYDLGSTNDTSININASSEDSKSTISGTGKKNLLYGKNTFKINVKAENGSTKTYTLNITRIDNRSNDNYLSSLKVSGVDLKFNKTTEKYDFIVEHSLESVTISATVSDSKAKVSGTGTKKLVDYTNSFNVTVEAENGSKRVYKIEIKRKNSAGTLGVLSANNSIKSLKIKNYDISFNSNNNNYYVEVKNDVNTLNLDIVLSDSKAKYEIKNNSNFDKPINVVTISVTSESGSTKDYKINVLKKDLLQNSNTSEENKEEVKNEQTPNEKKDINIFMIISIIEFIIIIIVVLFKRKNKNTTL